MSNVISKYKTDAAAATSTAVASKAHAHQGLLRNLFWSCLASCLHHDDHLLFYVMCILPELIVMLNMLAGSRIYSGVFMLAQKAHDDDWQQQQQAC